MLKLRNNQKGMTLIELLIATTVFSMVLLIVLYAFLFVSKDYTRSYAESQTQEAARNIVEDISQEVQLNGNSVSTPVGNSHLKDAYVQCIGQDAYVYQLNVEVLSSTGTHGLVFIPDGCGAAEADIEAGTLPAFTSGSQELLGNQMRLGQFEIINSPSDDGSYTINLSIGYGNALDAVAYPSSGAAQCYEFGSNTVATPPGGLPCDGSDGANTGGYIDSCPGLSFGGEFCAVSQLSTVVQPREGSQ